MFNEICIYEAKIEKQDEIEALMNRIACVLLSLAMLLSLCVCVKEPTSPTQVSQDIPVVVLWEAHGYRFPFVTIGSEYADKINSEINCFSDEAKRLIELNGGGPYWSGADYKVFINDNIVSLLLIEYYSDSGEQIYHAYNFYAANGEEITNVQLLESKGFSQKEFEDSLTDVFVNYLDYKLFEFFKNANDDDERDFEAEVEAIKKDPEKMHVFGTYEGRYEITVASAANGVQNQMFLNENGVLCIIAEIGRFLGGGDSDEQVIEYR